MGSPVNNISIATFFGTDLPTATAGVEQNKPTFTLKLAKMLHIVFTKVTIVLNFTLKLKCDKQKNHVY